MASDPLAEGDVEPEQREAAEREEEKEAVEHGTLLSGMSHREAEGTLREDKEAI
jgi:hypothetical protein